MPSLFSVDELPARSGVTAELVGKSIRFRGFTMHRFRRKIKRVSLASGWFSLDDCPIHLVWRAFEWE